MWFGTNLPTPRATADLSLKGEKYSVYDTPRKLLSIFFLTSTLFLHPTPFLSSIYRCVGCVGCVGWDGMITNEEEMSLYRNIIGTISIV